MRGLAAFAFSFPLLRGDPPPVSTRTDVCQSGTLITSEGMDRGYACVRARVDVRISDEESEICPILESYGSPTRVLRESYGE
ncbi:hypothetical protein BDW60DRAFT_176149 [Aspergillus nidulans var. acristatus]